MDPINKAEIIRDKPGNSSNMLGISEGKVKFNPHSGQKEFRDYVEQRADHMCDTGYVQGEPDDFNWHFEPQYQLSKLTPLKKDAEGWKAWYHGELHEWEYDHGDERKGHFEKWAQNPAEKPIIVIEGLDDRDHVVDGHHRCGMAHIKNMKTIPVLYGRRKMEKSLASSEELESLNKADRDLIEELAKKCPRCGGASANSSNPAGRCRKHLTQLSENKKKPGHWQRAQTKADDALRRQDGKNGTASHKSSGRGDRASIVKQTQSAEKKTGEKLSPDRKDNGKGYASSNTRMVPEKLNRGRHKVDPKKLAAWKSKLKKHGLDFNSFMTLLRAKAIQDGNEALEKSLQVLDIERLLGSLEE